MARHSLEMIKERAERIRLTHAVRAMPEKTTPLILPTRLVEEMNNPKNVKNLIDIDKLAADAKAVVAKAVGNQADEDKKQDEEEKAKVLNYALKRIKDLKKKELVAIVSDGKIQISTDKNRAALIDAIMITCESKGTEWLLKMI